MPMDNRVDTQAETASRLEEAEALLAISAAVTSTLDIREALRRICRELTRLLGADTGAAYLLDPASDHLVPVAGYHVPADLLRTLLAEPVPLREQGFHIPIWRDRCPVMSDDVASDERFRHSLFQRFRHQSGLVLPLILDAEVAGAFYLVWWSARRQLSAHDAALMDGVLGQVRVLLRNARLFEQAEKERLHLQMLYDLSRRLASVPDAARLLSMLLDEAGTLVGADAAGIRLLEGDDLVVVARTDSAARVMARPRIAVGESLSGMAVATGEPVAIEDVTEDPRLHPMHRQGAVEQGFHGFLAVPLRLHGAVIGVLTVYVRRRRRFLPDDISLLSALGDQASLAIHKATLLREAEDARAMVERLHRVAVSMLATPDREDRLAAFTRGAHEAVGFDRVTVLLVTEDRQHLELVAAYGEDDPEPLARLPLSPAAGALHHVIETRAPMAVLDDAQLARVPPLDPAYACHSTFRSRRFVVAPLVVGERAIGAVIADNKRSRRPIPAASVEPFAILCQQLATALEEARLHAESRVREDEAVRLYELAADLASSLDLDATLDRITSGAVDLLGSDAAGVYVHDERRGGLVYQRGLNLPRELVENLVLRPGEGVAGRAYQERRPAWTRDLLGDVSVAYDERAVALVRALSPRGLLAVPIVSHDEIHGVLMAHFFEPHDFSPREIRLLSTLADQAAIAVANARLYEATRAQEARLAQIFDSTSDGIVLVGRDGRIEAANRRAAELLDVERQAILGLQLAELMAGTAAGAESVRALGAFAGDPEGEAEGDFEQPARQRVLHWVARAAPGAAGTAGEATLTFRDVTRDREVAQMKSDFVSFVTHQLRTPLAGIRWMLELAAQEPDLPGDAVSYLKDAQDANQRLIGLVNDLLDVSRLERGRLTLTLETVSLAELTRSLVAETALLVQARGHALSVAGEAEAPLVSTDRQLLRQVLLNLVSNAVKYTPPGGTIAIAMGREPSGPARWAITDSGIGIPRAAQERLFEKFYRAENVATIETEGTGLGLYIVRLIVDQLGGRVWCESEEGKGATFVVVLPAAAP